MSSIIRLEDISGAIFDMDGVLLDSMPMWNHAGEIYLKNMGKNPEIGLEKKLFSLTMENGAQYIKDSYKLNLSTEEILAGINDTVRNFYANEVVAKPGVIELLQLLKKSGKPMTVATTTERQHVEVALRRTGILEYVDKIFTCSEVGAGKHKPDIYLRAADYMKTEVEKTFVFEDAYHGAKTAKNAGFKVVGLYDEASSERQVELMENSSFYFRGMEYVLRELSVTHNELPPVLTIAGSDSSGGAGVQADLKTMQANGVYGMSAITALTAQNTLGIKSIMNVTPEFLDDQLAAVFEDIPPRAVKIGMVPAPELIEKIVDKLVYYRAENVIVDPVMVSTSGAKLIEDEAVAVLTEKLFPLAKLITPNIPEAEKLVNRTIENETDMEVAAEIIYKTYGVAVLIKGGHSVNDAKDLLYDGEKYTWFLEKRIDNPNTHGTGCTLSSAIASNLAKGYNLVDSVRRAKNYISGALEANLNLGSGSGPLNHGYDMVSKYML
jgi:hydroxymethylpyrimidine kinase/phosphomethylpyrimidine kinase